MAVVVALLVFLLATRREESEVARVLLTIATQRSLLLRHPQSFLFRFASLVWAIKLGDIEISDGCFTFDSGWRLKSLGPIPDVFDLKRVHDCSIFVLVRTLVGPIDDVIRLLTLRLLGSLCRDLKAFEDRYVLIIVS